MCGSLIKNGKSAFTRLHWNMLFLHFQSIVRALPSCTLQALMKQRKPLPNVSHLSFARQMSCLRNKHTHDTTHTTQVFMIQLSSIHCVVMKITWSKVWFKKAKVMRSKVKLRSPGYEKGRVMMTWVTVIQNIVALLPRAEVMKCCSGEEVYIRSFLR